MTTYVYHYDPVTFEYTGLNEAHASPEEQGIYLCPASATFTEPPTCSTYQVVVFEEIEQTWEVKSDWRGVVLYDKDTKVQNTISVIGVNLSQTNLTELVPGIDDVWYNNTWTFSQEKYNDRLGTRREIVWEKVREKYNSVISGGVSVLIDGSLLWFHTDPMSRTLWMEFKDALTLDNNAVINYRTMSGNYVLLTPSIVDQVSTARNTMVSLAFSNKQSHRTALLLSENPEDYNYNVNWPVDYAEQL